MPPRIEVHGVRETIAAFDRIEADARDLSRPNAAIGDRVAKGIRTRSRRKSGALRASYQPRVTAQGVEIASELPYAGPQEYGWRARNIEPTGAIAATLEAETAPIVALYDREIENIIRRHD